MYKYKCSECGFEFDDVAYWEESRGEYWGVPVYETCCGCPACHGDYEEITETDDEDESED